MLSRTLPPAFPSFDIVFKAGRLFVQLAFLVLLSMSQVAYGQTNGGAIFSQMSPPPTSGTVGSDGLFRVTVGGIVIANNDVWPTQTIMSAELMEGSTVYSSAYWERQMGNDGESAVNVNRGFSLAAALGPGTHTLTVRTYTDSGRVGYSPTYTVNVSGPPAQNGAAYDSQSLPSQIVVGASYTANVTMKNTGTTTWASGTYWLGSIGDAVWGTTKVDAGGVAPGQSLMFWIPITAPTTAGTYNFRWQMFQNGVAFGTASPATAVPVVGIPPPTVTLSSTGNGRHYEDGWGYVAFTGSASPGTGATLKSLDLVEGNTVIKPASSVSSFSETLTLYATSPPPSSRTFRLRSIDSRDQSSLSSAVTIYFDAPTPKVALTKPANGAVIVLPSGATTTDVQIKGTGTAAPGYTLTKLELVVDGTVVSTPLTGSIDKTVSLKAGSHTILLRAADTSGSPAVTDTATISVATTGSAVTFSSVALTKAGGAVLAGQTLSSGINGYVKASGLSAGDAVYRVELREGSSVLNAMDFPFEMSSDGENPVNTQRNFYNMASGFAPGTHDIYVRAYTYQGSYGDTAHFTVTVTSNAAKPTVVFTAPTSAYSVAPGGSATVQITGSASDAGGSVARIDLLDNGSVIDGATGASINKTVQIGAGTHKLKLRATDNEGAPGDSDEYTVTVTVIVPDPKVDFTAPTASIIPTTAATVSVSMGGTAQVFGGRTVKLLELYDETGLIKSVTTTTISASKAFSPGKHTLRLRILDSGGAEQSVERVFTVVAQTAGNGATFISQTVPTTMQAGQPYSITVVMMNTGTTSWTSANSYQIVAQSPQGDRTWMSYPYVRVPGTIAFGATATFTIPIIAPVKPATYTMQWQMQAASTPFGESTPTLSLPVTAGTRPTGTLIAEPNNVRGASAPVTFTATASAAGSTGKLKKLELFRDPLNGSGLVSTGLSTTSSAATLTWKPSQTVSAGLYMYVVRVTDSADVSADSPPIYVNVTNSTLPGTLTGVRLDQNKKPQLIGWVCQPSTAQFLNYQLFLDAPTLATGGTQLASGVANVSTETDDAAVKSTCSTPSTSHHLNVDLSPYTAQYAGRPIYVVAQGYSGGTSVILPCANNNCTIPGAMRIGMATPLTGDLYVGPASVYMRAVVTGAVAPFDEVSLSVDDVWTAATLESPGVYSLTKASVANRATPYRIQARVRQGNSTVYSAKSLITVATTAPTTVAMAAPLNGSTVPLGMPMTLTANVSGGVSKIKSVKFYANGNLVATGVNSNDSWNSWTTAWSGAVVGQYTIQAKAFDGSGVQLGLSTTVAITVADMTTSSKPEPFNISLDALSYSDAGTLPGNLGVGLSGEATYSIELVTPPGTNGLQPALALNYSSSGPNGIVGLGWGLSGMSSIHRCGKTIAQDQLNARINFDKGDRLCLDGERLVLVSNTPMSDDAYWADNAVYRTEIDSFTRVSAQGTGSARTFKVEQKDGKTLTFGDASAGVNARVIGYVTFKDGQPLPAPVAREEAQSWAVDKIVDRSGNFMTFHYSQTPATGEHVLDSIRYGGNGMAPHAMVKFTYEGRTDSWTRYIDGTRHDLRQRIALIETYAGENMSSMPPASAQVRSYALSYEISPTSGRSLLNKVTVSARNPATGNMDALPPTEFSWGKPKTSSTPAFVSKGFWPGAPILTTHAKSGYKSANHAEYFAFVDMENHGLADVLEKRIASPADPAYAENSATAANPWWPGTMQTSYRYFHNNGGGFDQYQYQLSIPPGKSGPEKFAVLDLGDFNGDGAPDLLVATESGEPRICLSPLGQGINATTTNPIVFSCASATDRPALGANTVDGIPFVVDVVGDGRSAIYGEIDAREHKASVYIQNEKLVDPEPPYAVLPYTWDDRLNTVSDPLQTYVSFGQSVDFAGIGKHADVRWALPYFKPPQFDQNNEPVGYAEWVNMTPFVTITDFRKPNTPRLGRIQSFALHDEYPKPTCLSGSTPDGGSYYRCDPAPYKFDGPIPTGGAVADFSGSGYSNLMFGFIEVSSLNSATRADAMLCLSTGRELDCGKLPQHSDDQYKVTQAIANFVGDGAPSVLMQETRRGTDTNGVKLIPVPVGPLQMCRMTGMGNTITEALTNCSPWTGLTLGGAAGGSTAVDQVYFMDLLGTGRTQAVYYHAGEFKNGVWQENSAGQWEVFEPLDVAAAGEALDRIHEVKNGLGAVSRVEYTDGLVKQCNDPTNRECDPVVGRRGATDLKTSYPAHVALNPGQVVRRLKTANGVAGQNSTSYRYFDPAVDLQGRGSLGFGEVESKDEKTGIVTTTAYSHVWQTRGMVRGISVVAPGNVQLAKTTNSVKYKELVHPSGQQTVFPYSANSEVVRRDLDGSALGTVTVTNQYNDDWGNLSQQDTQQIGGGETHTSRIVNTYQDVAQGSWLLGLPTRVTVTQTNPTGTLTRTTGYSYDASGRLYTETIEPDAPLLRVVTTLDRTPKPGLQAQGLVSKKTQTWRDPVLGADVTRTVADMTYDKYGRYPLTVVNALGESEERTYDAATGVPLSLNARDGLKTIWTLDSFGRVKSELTEDGNEKLTYFKNCQSDCPLGSAVIQITETLHRTVNPQDTNDVAGRVGAPRMVYSDSVGHVVRTKSWGYDGNVTIAEQEYDDLGRVKETYQPGYGARGQLAVGYTYDMLNRVKTTKTLDKDGSPLLTTTTYEGYNITLINPLNQQRKDTRNVVGKVVQVKDAKNLVTKFEYDPFGNLSKTIDPKLNEIIVMYDVLGRKTDLKDPDLGWIHYDVDPLGRVYRQVNPVLREKSEVIEQGYDALDRMTSRVEPELKSYWVFATQKPASAKTPDIGKLTLAYNGTLANPTYNRTHSYDKMGRPLLTIQSLSDGPYSSKNEYDPWGRLIRQTFQRKTDAAKWFDFRYNNVGYQSRVEHNGIALSSVLEQDASNRPTKIALGNGLVQTREFNANTGYRDGGDLIDAATNLRMTEDYQYNKIGSVSKRTLKWDSAGFDEDFEYDELNRLSKSTISGQVQEFTYDDIGNLKTKTGISGTYNYATSGAGVVRPHALLGFGSDTTSFTYDANGNQKTGAGRAITWTKFDMPLTITKGTYTSQFTYGPEHQRTWQNRGDGTQVIYAGAQEVEVKGSDVTVKTYWPVGLGMDIDRPGATAVEMSWTHTDNLGSVVGITNEQGKFREGGKLEYDAWGKRRSVADNVTTSDSIDGVVDNRGFTGHEMLDLLDLVHMNGRVYDPLTAKFLSGDPVIQDPTNGQNYNRYSYVLNNPTNKTDPTGFCATGTEQTGTRICAKDSVTEISDGEGGTKLVSTKLLNEGMKANGFKLNSYGVVVNDPKSQVGAKRAIAESANTNISSNPTEIQEKAFNVRPIGDASGEKSAAPLLKDSQKWPKREGLSSDGRTLTGEITFTCSPPGAASCQNMKERLSAINSVSKDGYAIDLVIRQHGSKWTDLFSSPDIKFYVRKLDYRGEMNQGGLSYLSLDTAFSTPTHELGHWLGFDHSRDPKSLMYPGAVPGRLPYPNDAEIKSINEYYKK